MEPITITYVDTITQYKTISSNDDTIDGNTSGHIKFISMNNSNINNQHYDDALYRQYTNVINGVDQGIDVTIDSNNGPNFSWMIVFFKNGILLPNNIDIERVVTYIHILGIHPKNAGNMRQHSYPNWVQDAFGYSGIIDNLRKKHNISVSVTTYQHANTNSLSFRLYVNASGFVVITNSRGTVYTSSSALPPEHFPYTLYVKLQPHGDSKVNNRGITISKVDSASSSFSLKTEDITELHDYVITPTDNYYDYDIRRAIEIVESLILTDINLNDINIGSVIATVSIIYNSILLYQMSITIITAYY